MNLSEFDYNLPKELIAQYPVKGRDSSRLMVLNRQDSTISGTVFKNIIDYLRPGDLLVLNNTKVLPSRLIGSRVSGGKVDILLLSHKQGLTFKALIKPGKIKLNEKIIFADKNIYAFRGAKDEVIFYGVEKHKMLSHTTENSTRSKNSFAKGKFSCAQQRLEEIYNLGAMPLPPYIKRPPEESDKITYQTVYASVNGSIAEPTA